MKVDMKVHNESNLVPISQVYLMEIITGVRTIKSEEYLSFLKVFDDYVSKDLGTFKNQLFN